MVLSGAWEIYKNTVANLLPKMGSFRTNLVQQNYFWYIIVAQLLFDEYISLSCHLSATWTQHVIIFLIAKYLDIYLTASRTLKPWQSLDKSIKMRDNPSDEYQYKDTNKMLFFATGLQV